MKHAGDDALDQLEDLLTELRAVEGLREKKRGAFSHRSKSVLHFHEDPTGLFVDVRSGEKFTRLPVNTANERAFVVDHVRGLLALDDSLSS
jgi:hypothetical protein